MAGCNGCEHGKETFKVDVVGTVVYCKKKGRSVIPELFNNCPSRSTMEGKKVARRVFPDENVPCDNPFDEVKRLEGLLRNAKRENTKLLDMIGKMRGASAVVIKAADKVLGAG